MNYRQNLGIVMFKMSKDEDLNVGTEGTNLEI